MWMRVLCARWGEGLRREIWGLIVVVMMTTTRILSGVGMRGSDRGNGGNGGSGVRMTVRDGYL